MMSKIFGLMATGLLAAAPAQAITVTLDNTSPTILRPASGFVDVLFTGTITYGPGETFNQAAVFAPRLGSTANYLSVDVCVTFGLCSNGGSGTVFSARALFDSVLGLYNGIFTFTGTLATGGQQTFVFPYSVNLVGAVPEPGTLALLGLGLAGLGLSRRRKAT